MKKEILSWVKTIIMAVILAFVVDTVFIVNATVPTGSMENTIMAGDRILALRTSYWFSDPERGDVVVFEDPDDPTGKTLYVKRIIGVGGDTVEVKDGEVLVNGQVQDEPYIKEITEGDFGPYHVPEGCYFMMGDNRNKSLDARFWENTYVEKDAILGKVVLRYYKDSKSLIDLEEDRNRNEKRNTWLDRNNCRGGFAGIFDKSLFAGECICANRLYGKYDYGRGQKPCLTYQLLVF